METEDILDESIDPTQIPPLNQKRVLAFVNHFLISTCTFLNEFGLQCEQRFLELERKLQKVEAGLVLLETKLATIPDDTVAAENTNTAQDEATKTDSVTNQDVAATTSSRTTTTTTKTETEVDSSGDTATGVTTEIDAAAAPAPSGVRARDDARYKRFFRMLQVGVPAQAVKLKMQSEGLEPSILDTPELMLPDGISA